MTNSQSYTIPGLIRQAMQPENIIKVVANVYNLDPQTIYLRCKKQPGVEARMMAMFWIRKRRPMSLDAVGLIFRKSHCTVLYAEKMIPVFALNDKSVRNKFIKCGHLLEVGGEEINEYLNLAK